MSDAQAGFKKRRAILLLMYDGWLKKPKNAKKKLNYAL